MISLMLDVGIIINKKFPEKIQFCLTCDYVHTNQSHKELSFEHMTAVQAMCAQYIVFIPLNSVYIDVVQRNRFSFCFGKK